MRLLGPQLALEAKSWEGGGRAQPQLLGEVCSFSLKLFFWPCCTTYGILVPRPRIEPMPPALEAWSFNHWTAREVPSLLFFSFLLSWQIPRLVGSWPCSKRQP